jgi:gas vesicle protein
MKTSNNTIKIVGFSLLAGMVGAGIGLLFAPHKGTKTRRRVAERAKDIAEDIQDKIKDEAKVLSNKVEELEDLTLSAIGDIIKDVKHKVNGLVHH